MGGNWLLSQRLNGEIIISSRGQKKKVFNITVSVMDIQEIEQHNKAVEAERKAYHERRSAESENYKRVYDNITKMYDNLAQQNVAIQKAVSETQRIAEEQNLEDKNDKPLVPKTDVKPETSAILENFGFMIIAEFFGMWPNVPLDLEHFEEDKPYYEEYFKVESEFNKRIILPTQPDR